MVSVPFVAGTFLFFQILYWKIRKILKSALEIEHIFCYYIFTVNSEEVWKWKRNIYV